MGNIRRPKPPHRLINATHASLLPPPLGTILRGSQIPHMTS